MIKDIYIFGSGGFGKEIYFLIKDINEQSTTYDVKGFFDYEEGELTINDRNLPIYSEEALMSKDERFRGAAIAIAVGSPPALERIVSKLSNLELEFPNLIHPDFVGFRKTIGLGKGNIICSGCKFTIDIEIGSFNVFNLNCTLGHDSVIGDFTIVNPGANISGNVQMGHRCMIGTNATILQNICLEDNVIVGAAAVVTKNIEEGITVVGNPARPLKK